MNKEKWFNLIDLLEDGASQELMFDLLFEFNELEERVEKLEKALDKACYMLNGYMAREWKEWLLKEVQEDD